MTTQPEPSTELGLHAVRQASGAVIVDLDETLWLRNSTEEYLDSIRPRWLVAAVLIMLRIFPVWRLMGTQEDAEDWFRVVVCSVVFPWAIPLWRRRVRTVGVQWLNRPLADAIVERFVSDGRVIVATRGFDVVVEPLVASFDLPAMDVVACRFRKGRLDRHAGKLAMLDDRYGSHLVNEATVITDSETDRPLLDRCAVPVLLQWPDARYVPAPRTYAPFGYTEMYKRWGQRYVFHIVLVRDLPLWAIATATIAPIPAGRHLVGLAMLAVSFWCVYDVGYLENDRVAKRWEHDAVLPARPLPGRRFVIGAWAWALGLGAAAVYLLRPGEFLRGMGFWLGLLAGLRLVFFLYNHLEKSTRPVLYSVLQALRLLAPLAVVAVASAGVIALLLLSWSRSMLYVLYRSIRTPWLIVPHGVIDLVQLAIAYITLWRIGVRLEPEVVAMALAWMAFISRGEIRSSLATVRLISHSGTNDADAGTAK